MLVIKRVFIESEYNFRHALDGKGIWLDRAVRFLLAGSIIYVGLAGSPLILPVIGVLIGNVQLVLAKKEDAKTVSLRPFHLTRTESDDAFLPFCQLLHRRSTFERIR